MTRYKLVQKWAINSKLARPERNILNNNLRHYLLLKWNSRTTCVETWVICHVYIRAYVFALWQSEEAFVVNSPIGLTKLLSGFLHHLGFQAFGTKKRQYVICQPNRRLKIPVSVINHWVPKISENERTNHKKPGTNPNN